MDDLRGALTSQWRSGALPHAAHLPADAANECRRIGRVGRGQVGNLRGDDVVEDTEAGVHHGPVCDLVGDRDARLPNQQGVAGNSVRTSVSIAWLSGWLAS